MELERDATNAWDGRDWFAILLLALLVTVAFADILFLGRNFYVRDVYTFYYPTKKLIRDLVLSGQFPQWNPHYGAGQPLAANPEYEIFYPLQWLIFLPGYALAFRLHILVHFYLAIGGAYAFFRSLDLRRAASAAGAISFALGGMLLSTTALLPYLFILAWAPWLALHARRYLLGGSYRDLALAATALGMQFLVGEPTTVMQSVFVLVTAAFFIGSVSVSLRRTAAIVGAGFLIGAAQIFPTIDFARDTVRSWVFPYPLVVSWSLPPVRLLELLHPTLFGRYFDSMQWYWGGSLYTTGTPFFWSIYCGVAVAILALAGLVTESRGRWLFAIVSVFSILLAAGGHTPFFAALYDAGLLRNLRYPEKFILMEACAVIAFGTVVLDRILDRDRRTFRVALSIAAALAAVSFLVAVLSSTASFQPLFASMFRLVPSPSTDYETTLASVEWWKETARLLLFAALLGAWWQWPRRETRALIVLFVAADVLSVAREASPSIGRELFDPPPLVRGTGGERLFNEGAWRYLYGNARPLPSSGDAYYWIVRNGLMMKNAALAGIDPVLDNDYDLTNLIPATRFVQAMWIARPHASRWPQPFATMADASLHATLLDPAEVMRRTAGAWPIVEPVRVAPVSTSGRYYFADRIETFRSDDEFASRVVAPFVTPATAFLAAGERAEVGEGTIDRVEERADEATLHVVAQRNAFLVRSVTPHRYWKAWIDGAPARIVPTNIAFQGVAMPAGSHTVVFRYHNPLLLPSALLSIAATLAAGFLITRRRRGES